MVRATLMVSHANALRLEASWTLQHRVVGGFKVPGNFLPTALGSLPEGLFGEASRAGQIVKGLYPSPDLFASFMAEAAAVRLLLTDIASYVERLINQRYHYPSLLGVINKDLVGAHPEPRSRRCLIRSALLKRVTSFDGRGSAGDTSGVVHHLRTPPPTLLGRWLCASSPAARGRGATLWERSICCKETKEFYRFDHQYNLHCSVGRTLGGHLPPGPVVLGELARFSQENRHDSSTD